MIAVSEATWVRIRAVFRERDHANVERALRDRCGDNLPFVTVDDLAERIRFAVLKLSAGDLARMEGALALAASDWRDVLMAAGFGNDVKEHLRWMP